MEEQDQTNAPYGWVCDVITDERIRPATKEDLDKTLNSYAIGYDGVFELNGDGVWVMQPGIDY